MSQIPEAAVEAALTAQHRAYDEADPAPGPFAWPDDFAKCDQVVMRRAMRAAIEAALPHLAATAVDVALTLAMLKVAQDDLALKGSPHTVPISRARLTIAAITAERDRAEAKVAKWLAENEEVFEATRKQRDTYGERALKAEAERDDARRHIVAFKDNLKVAREANCTLEAERDALAERLRALEVRPQTREIEYD